MTGRCAAFYAPMKGPDHPVPSGDRTVARLYLRALEQCGFRASVVSTFQSRDGAGDVARQRTLMEDAQTERERIAATWRARPAAQPSLWFTYHLYHKAPDLLGPALCRQFAIPYVIAEPSFAPKRATGPWAAFHAVAREAIAAADLAVIATERDAACVLPVRAGRYSLRLPPFIDCADWPEPQKSHYVGALRLVTVAMMRPGDKLASYALLAEALELCPHLHWRLTIVGDGPARSEVEGLFAPFGDRVVFAGATTERADLLAHFSGGDLFVWPAVNEAYGVALMEAQAMGLPVLVGREGGVAEVVEDGLTGALTEPRNAADFAGALGRLAGDRDLLRQMGVRAARRMRTERSLEAAAAQLGAALYKVVPPCA